jgi:hypothetical protein
VGTPSGHAEKRIRWEVRDSLWVELGVGGSGCKSANGGLFSLCSAAPKHECFGEGYEDELERRASELMDSSNWLGKWERQQRFMMPVQGNKKETGDEG